MFRAWYLLWICDIMLSSYLGFVMRGFLSITLCTICTIHTSIYATNIAFNNPQDVRDCAFRDIHQVRKQAMDLCAQLESKDDGFNNEQLAILWNLYRAIDPAPEIQVLLLEIIVKNFGKKNIAQCLLMSQCNKNGTLKEQHDRPTVREAVRMMEDPSSCCGKKTIAALVEYGYI